MDTPADFLERPKSPSSVYYSSHSTPESDCYSTSSAPVGLGVSFSQSLDPSSTSSWSQGNFIDLNVISTSAQYPAWSETTNYDTPLAEPWSQAEYFHTSVTHHQPSPVPQSQYPEQIPVLLSSSCTSVSSRCHTPSSFTSSPQAPTMTTPSRYQYLLPQTEGYMPYPDPSAHSHYSTNSPLYPYPELSSTENQPHKTEEVKQEEPQEPSMDSYSMTELFNQDQDLTYTEKMQVMEERTKLVRVRNPRNRPTSSTEIKRGVTPSKVSKNIEPKPRCNICNKDFSRRHNLDQHNRRKHPKSEDECAKLFPCSEVGCPKEFDRQADLTRHHDSVHEKKRDWRCALCDSTFPRKDTLRRHFNQSCLKQRCRPIDLPQTENQ